MLVYDAWLRMKKGFALYYYEVWNGEGTCSSRRRTTWTSPRSPSASGCVLRAREPDAGDGSYGLQENVTRMRGIERGTPQAEGFIRHVQSPDFTLPLIS